MQVGIIVQARLNSRRFPKKIIKKIFKNYTILDFLLQRLKPSRKAKKLVLAVPKSSKNQFDSIAKKNNFYLYKGPEKNVLKRFYNAAKYHKLDIIVRVTSDSPLMSSKIIDKSITEFIKKKVDYYNNILKPSYPLGIHLEIFKFKTLEYIFKKTKKKEHQEHVTPYIYNNKKKFKIFTKVLKKNLKKYRFTIDYKKDLFFFREVLKKSKKGVNINFYDVISIMKKYKYLRDINKNFEKRFYLNS